MSLADSHIEFVVKWLIDVDDTDITDVTGQAVTMSLYNNDRLL